MDFNPAGIPQDWTQISSLVELLRYRAQYQANERAFVFLKEGEQESESLTFQMLDLQARAIAAHLLDQGATGTQVLLTYPLTASLDFIAAFFGCLYAGAIAVPAWPPMNQSMLSEIAFKASDSAVKIALTTRALRSKHQKQLTSMPNLAELTWIETDVISTQDSHGWKAVVLEPSYLAYLQYSSGSTGAPKGAMITHGNALNNLSLLSDACNYTEQDKNGGVCWLPLYHDMGLVGGVLQPIYTGGLVIMMSPVDFILKPIRWLKAISQYKASTTGGPNFAYDLCIRKITPQLCAGLDLSSWGIAVNGAEPISADTMDNFTKQFAPYGFKKEAFCPAYGMSETTVMVTLGNRQAPPVVKGLQEDALAKHIVQPISSETLTEPLSTENGQAQYRMIVGCGQIGANHTLMIVDPDTRDSCLGDRVGEIWVNGPSVAKGYWNRPEATEETFRAYLSSGEGPFLRTGDLGFVQDNELFITGRLKDIIILWGRNHYPHHIEATVEKSHPSLRPGCGAVFGLEVDGIEQCVVTQEVESSYLKKVDIDSVIQAIRLNLALQHAIEAYAIVLTRSGSTPKTPTGKIQRSACRSQFLNGDLKVIQCWNNPQVPEGILVPSDL
jgi:acyl-CoA synthetase (AMP-forming)/AMP-acid ligase II